LIFEPVVTFRTPHSALRICFEFPVLAGASFAEIVEGADADESFHFLGQRLDAQDEIGEGGEGAVSALAQDGVFSAGGEALDQEDGNADRARRGWRMEDGGWRIVLVVVLVIVIELRRREIPTMEL